jgi:hypothetical protein
VAGISAFLSGPIWKELCFRYLVLSAYKKKVHRLYLGVWVISKSSYPSVIRVENVGATMLSCFFEIMGMIILILGHKKYAKEKQ